MTIKDQFKKVKENWLLALVIVVLFLLPTVFSPLSGSIGSFSSPSYGIQEMALAKGSFAADAGSRYAPSIYPGQTDFAPEELDRLITKTASLSTEVKRGYYLEAESKLKAIIMGTDSFLLNEQVDYRGSSGNSQGSYQIKVESNKYDAVVTQLKEVGEVTYFSENTDDITGSYKNLKTELDAETARLARYQQMLSEAQTVTEKVELSDRIFNQERTIKYLEDALKNVNQQVSYSSIYITLNEKQSDYVNIALVKFSDLIRRLVDSFNSLLSLLFWVLPYAVVALLVWLGVRWVRRRK